MSEEEKKAQLGVRDLYVVSMPNPHDKGAPVAPWPGIEKLFLAEDCGRYTFVLSPEDFRSLPSAVTEVAKQQRQERAQGIRDQKNHPVRVEDGPRAYKRLLQLAVGLEDATT